jgi:hypothetical protein
MYFKIVDLKRVPTDIYYFLFTDSLLHVVQIEKQDKAAHSQSSQFLITLYIFISYLSIATNSFLREQIGESRPTNSSRRN